MRGLGPKLLGELVGHPLIQARFPQLREAMQAALDRAQAVQIHTGACRAVRAIMLCALGCLCHALPGRLEMYWRARAAGLLMPACAATHVSTHLDRATASLLQSPASNPAEPCFPAAPPSARPAPAERAYDQVRSSSILSLFGLPAFTNDGRRNRPQVSDRPPTTGA